MKMKFLAEIWKQRKDSLAFGIMKKMSVIASSDEVIRNLKKYLEFRKFKNINVNYSIGEIMAERKDFIFGQNHIVNLKVKQVNEDTTNIEVIVDPELKERSVREEKLEEKLRDHLYDFI